MKKVKAAAGRLKRWVKPKLRPVWHFTYRHRKALSIAGATLLLLLVLPTLYANISTSKTRFTLHDMDKIPYEHIAIVFGAGVYKDGTPTPYLKWRLDTAVQLYKADKVDKVLVSGDNRTSHYNEPEAMKKYLAKQIPADDIVMDFAGLSTYDTCYRAAHIFGVRHAILVSQGYHLPRAVMTCDTLGIDSIGVAAQAQGKDWTVAYIGREYISTLKSVFTLVIKPQATVMGKPEPIDPSIPDVR